MGEAKRKKEALKVTEAPKPKSDRFNINNYSKKIQRRYARLQKSIDVGGFAGNTIAEHYRGALMRWNKTGGVARGFESHVAHSAYKKWKDKPFDASKIPPTTFQQALNDRCSSGYITKPTNDETDWVGIEIECVVDGAMLPADIQRRFSHGHDAIAAFLQRERIQYYEVKGDGSLRNPENDKDSRAWKTVEVCIISQAGKPMQNVRRLCESLKKLDARVNRRCGLHVHVDVRHLQTDSARNFVGDRFVNSLPLLTAMQHPLRQESKFCKTGRNNLNPGDRQSDRYWAVNMESVRKHGTIELRLHSGTTDADKIIHWAKLLHAIKETNFSGFLSTPGDVVSKLPSVTSSTTEYIKARVDLFSGNLDEVAKKNRCNVPFVDEDAEEVRLADVVNGELLSEMMKAAKACSTWEDLASFLREQLPNKEAITEQLGQKQQLLYGEMLDSMIEDVKSKTGYLAARDEFLTSYFINACYKATTKAEVDKIDVEVHSSTRRDLDHSHPDYVRDSVLNRITPVIDMRKKEFAATTRPPAKVFEFKKLLKEKPPSTEPTALEKLLSMQGGLGLTHAAEIARSDATQRSLSSIVDTSRANFRRITLPDGRAFRVLSSSSVATLGMRPVTREELARGHRELGSIFATSIRRGVRNNIIDAEARGYIIDLVRPYDAGMEPGDPRGYPVAPATDPRMVYMNREFRASGVAAVARSIATDVPSDMWQEITPAQSYVNVDETTAPPSAEVRFL